MTTTYHTDISVGAAANASVFNAPLGQLDSAITTNATAIAANALLAAATTAEVVAARNAHASLDTRLDFMETVAQLAGGNVATKANGASVAGQKVLTVDATDGFIVGAYVTYLLNGTTLEGNTIASIQAGVSLTMGTNIGTGGVLDDSYISMISISEYQAAQAIPHAGTLMLPQTMEYANGGVFNVNAYGAVGDGTADDTAAFNAALVAIRASEVTKSKSAILRLTPGASYKITGSLDFTDIKNVVVDGGTLATTILYSDADATATNRVLFDCIGSAYLGFRNLTIQGDSTNVPAVAFSLGRTTSVDGQESGGALFHNVNVIGHWSIAPWYNVNSEGNTFIKCAGLISGNTTAKAGMVLSGYNLYSIGSEYATALETGGLATQWLSSCSFGCADTVTTFVPILLNRNVGNVAIRDCYIYTYNNQPAIKTIGNIHGLTITELLVEGSPGNTFHFTVSGAEGLLRNISLENVSFGTYATNAILADSGTTINGMAVRNSEGSTAGGASNITLSGECNWCTIEKWWTASSGTFTANLFFNSRLHVSNHTLVITNNAGTVIHSDVSGAAHYEHFQTGVRVGTIGATNLAEINDIRTASKSWSPGEIADNAQAETTVTISGVAKSDEWFCLAHYAGISGSAGWEISAVADDSVVGVIITNRTGGALTPSGTLHVAAIKVTAV